MKTFLCLILVLLIFIFTGYIIRHVTNYNPHTIASISGLYSEIYRDTALLLSEKNSEIAYYYSPSTTGQIYIVELLIDDCHKAEFQENITCQDMWIPSSKITDQEIQRYLFDFVDTFEEFEYLNEMISLCKEETFASIRVYEDTKYELDFCIAVYDPGSGRVLCFRWG